MLSDIANLKGGREKAQCCIFPNKSNKLRRFLEETVVDVFNINRDLCNIINVNNMADNMVQKPDLLISKDFDFKKYETDNNADVMMPDIINKEAFFIRIKYRRIFLTA